MAEIDSYTIIFKADTSALDKAIKAVQNTFNGLSKSIGGLSDKIDKNFNMALRRVKFDLLGTGFFFRQFGMEMRGVFQESENFLGISLRMARAVGGDLYSSMLSITARFQEFAMTLLDNAGPEITKLLDNINGLFDAFDKLDPKLKENIGTFVAWGVVLAPIIGSVAFFVMGVKGLFDLVGDIIAIITGIFKVAIMVIGVFSGGISSTFLSLIGWIIAVLAVITIFWNAWDMVFGKKGPEDLNIIQKAIALFGGYTMGMLSTIGAIFVMLGLTIAKFVTDSMIGIGEFVVYTMTKMKDLFTFLSGLPIIGGLFAGAAELISTTGQEAALAKLREMSAQLGTARENTAKGVETTAEGFANTAKMWGKTPDSHGGGSGGKGDTYIYMTESELGEKLSKMGFTTGGGSGAV